MISIKYHAFEMKIDPADGMNLCQLKWNGQVIIDADGARMEAGLTYGMPILFPTPNRTAENRYIYDGYVHETRMHGLVRNMPFIMTDQREDSDGHMVTGILAWGEHCPEFDSYPYRCRITVTIHLLEDQLNYTYDVTNLGDKKMPFGFGIHPFFWNGDRSACLRVDSDEVLDGIGQLNTGTTRDSAGTAYDVGQMKPVGEYELDHVYVASPREMAVMEWNNCRLTLSATDDFRYVVVYTPKDSDYFCIEPHTCCTDAMNLFVKGHRQFSGIAELEPKTSVSGKVTFSFSR